MVSPTEITLNFADGRYRFWLPVRQAIELEKKLESLGAPGTIAGMEWHLRQSIALQEDGKPVYTGGIGVIAQSLRETIRLALIGGGHGETDAGEIEVGPQLAKELVENYVYPARPLGEAAALTWRIVAAAMYGNDPEDHSFASPGDPTDPPAKPEDPADA